LHARFTEAHNATWTSDAAIADLGGTGLPPPVVWPSKIACIEPSGISPLDKTKASQITSRCSDF
jgi:hypothetical protein